MSESNIVIEVVTDVDASWDELLPLWKGQGDYHQPLHGWQLMPDWEQAVRERFKAGETLVIIARLAGRPVGFLNAVIRRGTVWENTHCYVENVFVAGGERGAGIGKALLTYAEDWSRSKGIYHMELIALANNDRAIAVWRRLGFEDAHIGMRKKLDGAP